MDEHDCQRAVERQGPDSGVARRGRDLDQLHPQVVVQGHPRDGCEHDAGWRNHDLCRQQPLERHRERTHGLAVGRKQDDLGIAGRRIDGPSCIQPVAHAGGEPGRELAGGRAVAFAVEPLDHAALPQGLEGAQHLVVGEATAVEDLLDAPRDLEQEEHFLRERMEHVGKRGA